MCNSLVDMYIQQFLIFLSTLTLIIENNWNRFDELN